MIPDGRTAIDYFMLRIKPKPDLLLINMSIGGVNGLEVIRAVRHSDPYLSIIVLSNKADSAETFSAIQSGVDDVVYKPANSDLVAMTMRNLLHRNVLRQEVRRLHRHEHVRVTFADLAGQSDAMLRMLAVAKGASDTATPLCIEGASGVGKESFARTIHGHSVRAGQPFVTINCDVIRQGADDAPSDAVLMREKLTSRLMAANGGTLLLKNPHILAKEDQQFIFQLLRDKSLSLAAGEIELNIRFMMAISIPLAEIFRNGELIDDLYYRFSALHLNIAPLRERSADIIPLAEMFLRRHSATVGKLISDMEPEAIRVLMGFQWPGNVTQLSHVIHHAVMDCKTKRLQAEHIMPYIQGDCNMLQLQHYERHVTKQYGPQGVTPMLRQDGNVRPLDELEAEMIRYAIKHYNGKMTEVARRLGIGRSTLYRKIQDYSLDPAC